MTVQLTDGLMGHNFIRNRPYMRLKAFHDAPWDLKDGLPVVCVGAGPSLNKNVHLLKDFKECRVFVTGRRLSRVLATGRVPDACFVLDPRPAELRFLGRGKDKVDTSNIPLIASTCASHEFVQAWEGPVYWVNPYHPSSMGKWYYQQASEFGCIQTSGNVGSMAMNYAISRGVPVVGLIGFDYSTRWPPLNAPRGLTEEQLLKRVQCNSHGKPTTMAVEWKNDEAEWWEVLDDTRRMDLGYLSYMQAMFEVVDLAKMITKVYNCTEGGVLYSKTVGIIKLPFEDFKGSVQEQVRCHRAAQDLRTKDLLYATVPDMTDAEAHTIIQDYAARDDYQREVLKWSKSNSLEGARPS